MTAQTTTRDGDLFNEALIRSYVNDNPRFLRRDWLADEVATQLAKPDCRFVLLTAAPGAGKSTFMAQIAADHPDWPRYFIRRDQRTPLGDVGAHSFLLRIGYQLAARYPEAFTQENLRVSVQQRLGTTEAASEVVGAEVKRIIASPFYHKVISIQQHIEQNDGRVIGLRVGELAIERQLLDLSQLLNMAIIDPARVLLKLHREARIVILVDALDETRYHDVAENILAWLTDCPELPANVRFVLSSRPPDVALLTFCERQKPYLRSLTIEPDNRHVQDDVRVYVRQFVAKPEVAREVGRAGQTIAGFADQVARKAHGNLGYLDALARAVDSALARADDQALDALRELLALRDLPDEIEGLYAFFLHQIKAEVEGKNLVVPVSSGGNLPAWPALYHPLLAVLCVALDKLTPDQIKDFGGTGVDRAYVLDALGRLRQFLDEVNGRWGLYHATVAEFLTVEATRQSANTTDLHVDPLRWHGQIAGYLQERYHDDWSHCDPYGLRYLPTHLFKAGDAQALRKLLGEFGWPQAKLAVTDVVSLIADYDLAEDDPDMRLTRDALRLSAHVLAGDKAQLPGQLVGRLCSFDSAGLRALVDSARAFRDAPWLCPLTPSLLAPGGPLLRTLKGRLGGHAGTPRSAAITPDGRWAISAGNSNLDQTVRVWDLETGECRRTLFNQAAPGGHTPVALAAGGDLAVTGYEDEIRAWDLMRGVIRDSLRVEGSVIVSIALTDDGHQALALSGDGSVRIWDLERRTATELPDHHGGIRAIAMTPDGRQAVSVSDALIKAWDLDALREISTLPARDGSPFDARVLALSPDGHSVLFGSPLRRWDIGQDAAHELPTEGIAGIILSVTPDGRRALAKTGDRAFGVWDLSSRRQLLEMPHEYSVSESCVAMTPDGVRAITADTQGDLRVWDLTTTGKAGPASALDGLQFIDFATQGKTALFRAPDGTHRLWNVDQAAFIPDSAATAAIIQDVLSDVEKRAVIQDGVAAEVKRLLTVSNDQHPVLEGSGEWLVFAGGPRQHIAVVTAVDGKRAVSAIGPQGKHSDLEEPARPAATDRHEEITLWDLGDRPARRALRGHSTPVTALDVTPDGRWAMTGCWGRLVRIWDLDAGAERWVLRGHGGIVSSVSITDDGRRGVSASEDSTTRMWDLETGEPIATFTGEGWMSACWISPDGGTMVAQERFGRLHILKLGPVQWDRQNRMYWLVVRALARVGGALKAHRRWRALQTLTAQVVKLCRASDG